MRTLMLTVLTLAALSTSARADSIGVIHIRYTNLPYNVSAVALDSVQMDLDISTMGVYVSVTDADGSPVEGLKAGDFTNVAVGAQSVTGDPVEVAPGVYMFWVTTQIDPYHVQGRSAVALFHVHHEVSTGLLTANLYQGQALAKADFSRVQVTCRR